MRRHSRIYWVVRLRRDNREITEAQFLCLGDTTTPSGAVDSFLLLDLFPLSAPRDIAISGLACLSNRRYGIIPKERLFKFRSQLEV